jgi:hypothetical protein
VQCKAVSTFVSSEPITYREEEEDDDSHFLVVDWAVDDREKLFLLETLLSFLPGATSMLLLTIDCLHFGKWLKTICFTTLFEDTRAAKKSGEKRMRASPSSPLLLLLEVLPLLLLSSSCCFCAATVHSLRNFSICSSIQVVEADGDEDCKSAVGDVCTLPVEFILLLLLLLVDGGPAVAVVSLAVSAVEGRSGLFE